MAGDILAKEVSIITLTSSGSSLTNGSGGSAGTTLDVRSAGNAADVFTCQFELIVQWATITSIIKDTVVAELYLVPALDGTNYPDVDTTSGSSAFPRESYAGKFTCVKAPSANTNMRFITSVVDVHPNLYTAYILNKSGQTMTANWTLKVVPAKGQYT